MIAYFTAHIVANAHQKNTTKGLGEFASKLLDIAIPILGIIVLIVLLFYGSRVLFFILSLPSRLLKKRPQKTQEEIDDELTKIG